MSATLDDAKTDTIPTPRHAKRPALPRFIRMFAIPIVLAWIALIAFLTTTVPQLAEVGKMRACR